MNKITYEGFHTGAGPQVIQVVERDEQSIIKHSRRLPHICKHSPDGFQWGYGGSGPSDAALSILTDAVGRSIAEKFYQDFKWKFIAIADKELCIYLEDIKRWIEEKQNKIAEK